MNSFLKKTIIFGLIILLFCIGLELLLLTKPNIYSYKRKYVENHLNDISFLIMGNSHTADGLIPELIADSSFNFAIEALDWRCNLELAERYIPSMKNLKIVLMPFSYTDFIFGRTIDDTEEMNPEEVKSLNTFKCMRTKYLKMRQYGVKYWSELLYSSNNYLRRLKLSKDTRDFCDSLGFVPRPTHWISNWKEFWVPEVVDTTKSRNESEFNSLLIGHKTIAKLCYEQGAKLILVSVPVYKTYQDAINDVVLQDLFEAVDVLKEEFDNVRYYNFFFTEGFDDIDFSDAGHLSETGAIKFSKMLADSLFPKNEKEIGFQP